MSDEKIQWSPEQPDDWQGAPLGTPSEWPAPATPPIQPSAPSSLAPVPVGAAVRASFQLLKAQYHRYLAISALSMGLGAIAASAVVTVLRANNMINDELIALVFRDTRFDELTAQEKDFLGAHVPGLILFAATTVLLVVLAQMVAQIAITARSLSRVSSTPEVPALKFSWWKAISSQLACLIVVLAAITPFGILLLLAASSTGAAILALVAFLAFLVFVVWFAVVSMMTLQHSIATGVGGFACIKQTIAVSKGARAASFVSVMLMGIVFAFASSMFTSAIDTAFVSSTGSAQTYWIVISQFLSAILTVPATTIALSATYSLRRSIR